MLAAQPLDASVLARYDLSGPRYTSYPTANRFCEDFAEPHYRAQASASNEDPIPMPLSLYLHVPFCANPCFYCGCTRIITRSRAQAEDYLSRLRREIVLQAALFDPDREVPQLHLGGGTPTFFDDRQMADLVDWLNRYFRLSSRATREYSIEVDPRTVNADRLRHLADLGFNRLSFGVQDFDPEVQAAVNRVQSETDTLRLLDEAREAGFKSTSVDLIYGLPRQTRDSFARTLDTIISARPARLSIYGYAHMPALFKAQRQLREEDLPDGSTRLALAQMSVERLTAAGYVYIGMDHFALPDDELALALQLRTLQRNFQGYSTHAECDLVGLGLSAIGKVGDCYSQNAKDLLGYYAALDAGQLPVQRGWCLDEEDRLRRDLIQAIMCRGEVRFADFESRLGQDFCQRFPSEMQQLARLAEDGLLLLSDSGFSLTLNGRLLMRVVAMVFDAWLQGRRGEPARFSRVV